MRGGGGMEDGRGGGGRGEYYTKIAGLREIISSTGVVANELMFKVSKRLYQ